METNQLTQQIIKAAYQVHNELGIGYVEKVYENALKIALGDLGLEARQQHPLQVHFRGIIVGDYFADLFVENRIILELKAVKQLVTEHQAQLINYLTTTRCEAGLLINFGKKGLEIKRAFSNSKV